MARIHLLSRPPNYPLVPVGKTEREALLATDNFDEGLITDIDPARIPPNGLSDAKNVVYTRGQLIRRNGTVIYPITKPNANKILGVFGFYHEGTGINVLRFTRNSVHRAGAAGWTDFPAFGIAAFSGSDFDYFFATIADNRMFVSNNGIDPIREVDPTVPNYKALGNAPRYRYVTSALNRVFGANLYVPAGISVPYEIGWSGNLNYDEWDTLVDPSAGSTPLVDSPSDVNDDITGVFSTANMVIVSRIRSMWIGVGQPAQTAPVRFFSALPRTGCDVPKAIKLTEFGMVFFNYQDASCHVWMPSVGTQSAEELDFSAKIRRAIKSSVVDPNYVFASYSQDTKTYSLCVANPNNATVRCWDYNFFEKKWTYSEFESLSELVDLDFAGSTLSIDELSGTIDALAGTINSLGGLVNLTTRFLGFENGELHTQTYFHAESDKAADIATTDNGTAFETVIGYKIIESPVEFLFANFVRADVTPYSTGTVEIQYSKDDGNTWTTFKSVTFVAGDLNKQYSIQKKKALRFKRIQWRLVTSDCMCTNNGFYVKALQAGDAKS